MATKKILTTLALLLVIVLSLPYFMGKIVQIKYNEVLAEISTMPGFTATSTAYQSGWRGASAKTEISYTNESFLMLGITMPVIFTLQHDIHYGPLAQVNKGDFKEWKLAQAVIHTELSDDVKKQLSVIPAAAGLFDMLVEVDITGAIHIRVKSQPLSVVDEQQGVETTWGGLRGDWLISRDYQAVRGELIIPELKRQSQPASDTLAFADIIIKSDMLKQPAGYWTGKSLLSARKFDLNDDSGVMVDFNAVSLGSSAKTANNMAEAAFTIRIEQLKTKNTVLGPVDVMFGMRNIADSFIMKIVEFQETVADRVPADEDFKIITKASIDDFLAAKPVISLNRFRINTKAGALDGTIQWQIKGKDINSILEMDKIFDASELTAHFTAPKEALMVLATLNSEEGSPAAEENRKQVDTLLTGWVDAGYLHQQEDVYELDFKMLNGVTTYHGKEQELPSLP